jgi:hypothetical protein
VNILKTCVSMAELNWAAQKVAGIERMETRHKTIKRYFMPINSSHYGAGGWELHVNRRNKRPSDHLPLCNRFGNNKTPR